MQPVSYALAPSGLLLIADGLSAVRRWDGFSSTFPSAGLSAPPTAVAIAASGSGTITGNYTAYQRFLDTDGNVSNLSPISNTVTAASNLTISYTSVDAPTETRVTRRQILRNTAGQTAVYYVDVDTTDLVSTSFSSTNTDAQLTTQTSVPLFADDGSVLANANGVPPDYKAFLAHHLDRMFLAGDVPVTDGSVAVTNGSPTVTGAGTSWTSTLAGRLIYVDGADKSYEISSVDASAQTLTLASNYGGTTNPYAPYAIRTALVESRTVYFSGAGLPESWNPTDALTLQADGDEITGLMPKASFLYILERNHAYRLTFQANPAVDGYVFLAVGRGCINNRSWVVIGDVAYLLDEQGIYSMGGGQDVEDLSGPLQNLFFPGGGVNWSARKYFHAVFHPGQQVVRFFVPLAGTYLPRHALCLDVRLKRWWTEEYPFPIGSSCLARFGGQPRVFLGGPGGRIYLLGDTLLDHVDANKGTIRGTVSSATSTSLSDSTASFDSSLVGAPVAIVSGRGRDQVRVITEVSAGLLRIDRPWHVLPDSTSIYQLGGVRWRYRSGWWRWADSEQSAARRLEVTYEPVVDDASMDLRIFLDRSETPVEWEYDYPAGQSAGFASTAGSEWLTADLTDLSGLAQLRIDGHKDRYIVGQRWLSVELSGVGNRDQVILHAMSVEGTR